MPKILAIDDKRDNLITLSAMLKAMMPGCEVITATSGPEGIEKAKTDLPDTILLDIKMPGMDGYEVCNRLKNIEYIKNIPVIMISAIRTGSEDLVKGLDTGADAYLAKPIDEYVLIAQVKTALRIKQAEDNLRNRKDRLEQIVQERTAALRQTNRQLQQEIDESRRIKEEKTKL
ncbi:MAG: response regulator [Deltaproteobacteria bacterium]|nr:response regulator [Deltaproteobacteria bacterium]